ncbi:MAG: hypothetical protein ABEJ06_00355 [Haloarculaceae archaeon]
MSTTTSPTTTGVSFAVGILLGSAFIAPVLPRVAATLPTLNELDPVGKALVGGAMAIVVLVFGVVALYLAFLVVED